MVSPAFDSGRLLLTGVPEAKKKKWKTDALRHGMSVSQLVIDVMDEYYERQSL